MANGVTMNDRLFTTIIWLITAILGVAIIAVIVSQRAATSDVLKASGSALSNILGNAFATPNSGAISIGGDGAIISLPPITACNPNVSDCSPGSPNVPVFKLPGIG